MLWAWVALYWAASLFVQIFMPQKFANGLTGKLLKRLKICRRSQFGRHMIRYYTWLMVFYMLIARESPLYWHSSTREKRFDPLFWAIAVAFVIDDYIFGDDNKWNKFKQWCGNKIKWLMDLPQPEPQEVVSSGS